jgi:DNA-binding NarL/FixJ family response regulator
VEETIVVRGDEELMARAGHVLAGVRNEFVCTARDPDVWARARPRHDAVGRAAGRNGARVARRKLYSSAALAGEAHRDHLRQLMAQGAEVRISGGPLPHETIIIDRRVVILASESGREFTVTTAPGVVAAMDALFRTAWEASAGLETYLRGEAAHLDDSARSILRALASGVTDEVACRRLELSLRTYRRRVAELMAALEADSRFQAGLRAGLRAEELGLADADGRSRR